MRIIDVGIGESPCQVLLSGGGTIDQEHFFDDLGMFALLTNPLMGRVLFVPLDALQTADSIPFGDVGQRIALSFWYAAARDKRSLVSVNVFPQVWHLYR